MIKDRSFHDLPEVDFLSDRQEPSLIERGVETVAFFEMLIPALGSLAGGFMQSNSADKATRAQEAAMGQVREIADKGYAANKGYIDQYAPQAQRSLDAGFQQGRDAFAPIMQIGDSAMKYYSDATGINGEGARDNYMKILMARPEFQAASQAANQATLQRYGGKLGSGPLLRSINRDNLANAENAVDKDLARVRPVMSAGLEARGKMADSYINQGAANAGQAWKTNDAYTQNEDQRTSAYAGAALGTGRAQAQGALMQGNAWANAFAGVGKSFGAASNSSGGLNSFGPGGGGFPT